MGGLAHPRRDVFAEVFIVPTAADQPGVFFEPRVIEQPTNRPSGESIGCAVLLGDGPLFLRRVVFRF